MVGPSPELRIYCMCFAILCLSRPDLEPVCGAVCQPRVVNNNSYVNFAQVYTTVLLSTLTKHLDDLGSQVSKDAVSESNVLLYAKDRCHCMHEGSVPRRSICILLLHAIIYTGCLSLVRPVVSCACPFSTARTCCRMCRLCLTSMQSYEWTIAQ
jgi:hypothetical protein